MEHKVNVSWDKKDLSFTADFNGNKLQMNPSPDVSAWTPKPLLLSSLGACTAMDVVSLLAKMRQHVVDFNVSVDGVMTEDHPKYYKTVKITYEVMGKDLELSKIEKAVNLSVERYCGVHFMLEPRIEIKTMIVVKEV